jgi:predicted MPP superfamily phosphohydrolase
VFLFVVSRLLLLQRHGWRLLLFCIWCCVMAISVLTGWTMVLEPGHEMVWVPFWEHALVLLLTVYWLEHLLLRRGRLRGITRSIQSRRIGDRDDGGPGWLRSMPVSSEAGALRIPEQLPRVRTTFDLMHRSMILHPPGFPADGRGLRLLLMSDFHFSSALPLEYVRLSVDQALTAGADMIVLTGDFAACEGVDITPFMPELSRLHAPLGVFGVMGNHDYGRGLENVVEELETAGVSMLMDEWRVVPYPGRPLVLAGTQWPWKREKRLRDLACEAPTGFRILLSHTPDNFGKAASAGFDLVLCGHTHAGQIRVPGLGALTVPCVTGRRFDHGLFRRGDTLMYVTSGIGCFRPLFRAFCHPELVLMEISGRKETSA